MDEHRAEPPVDLAQRFGGSLRPLVAAGVNEAVPAAEVLVGDPPVLWGVGTCVRLCGAEAFVHGIDQTGESRLRGAIEQPFIAGPLGGTVMGGNASILIDWLRDILALLDYRPMSPTIYRSQYKSSSTIPGGSLLPGFDSYNYCGPDHYYGQPPCPTTAPSTSTPIPGYPGP